MGGEPCLDRIKLGDQRAETGLERAPRRRFKVEHRRAQPANLALEAVEIDAPSGVDQDAGNLEEAGDPLDGERDDR